MKLHDLIIKYVTTSIDCSKVVDFIDLEHLPNFKLGEKSKKFEITKFGVFEVTNSYEVANIYNPQVRFSSENIRDLTFIKRIY
ncbi:unnamed protein product [Meloidogyne enterolobii]|uniref:Uncharacterized protein n=1 Tax=Meloidogyne enterolobii TaxID=390850 RepID=A0ACB1ALH7_MELEN